jgi:hypothetical protein
MIYGAPERQVAIDIAQTGINFLLQQGNEAIALENRRQISNAGIAMEKERHGLVRFMRENQRDPLSWSKYLTENKQRMRDAVIAEATQPGARTEIDMMFGEKFQALESWVSDKAYLQQAQNTNDDFETGRKLLTEEPYTYTGDDDVMMRLNALIEHVEGAWNGGNMPPDSMPNEQAKDLIIRDGSRKIVSDYILQQAAVLPEDEAMALIDSANTYADVFTPTDIQDLQTTYTRRRRANQAYAEIGRAEAQVKAEREIWDVEAKTETTPQDLWNLVDNLPADVYTPDEKDKLIRQITSRYELRRKGTDPLQARQDQGKYWELLQQAADGTLTEPEVRAAVNANQIAIGDYIYLTNAMKQGGPRAQAEEMVAVVKKMDTLIDKSDTIFDKKEILKIKGARMLEDRIQEYSERNQPLHGRELEDEMLRIYLQLEEEQGEAYDVESFLDIGASDPLYVPWVWNDEDYDALASGTRFKDPQGKIRIKP